MNVSGRMGDYISREETIEKLLKSFWDDKKTLRQCINEIPPADVRENRRGKWVHKEDMDYKDKMGVVHNHYMCEKCGFIHDFVDNIPYQFCPQCGNKNGADTRESEDANASSD